MGTRRIIPEIVAVKGAVHGICLTITCRVSGYKRDESSANFVRLMWNCFPKIVLLLQVTLVLLLKIYQGEVFPHWFSNLFQIQDCWGSECKDHRFMRAATDGIISWWPGFPAAPQNREQGKKWVTRAMNTKVLFLSCSPSLLAARFLRRQPPLNPYERLKE